MNNVMFVKQSKSQVEIDSWEALEWSRVISCLNICKRNYDIILKTHFANS